MPRTKGPMARVIALGVLLIVLGVALRGKLPGVQQAEPDRPTGGPAPLIGVIALVSAAMLVVAVAVVMSIREPGRPMPAARTVVAASPPAAAALDASHQGRPGKLRTVT